MGDLADAASKTAATAASAMREMFQRAAKTTNFIQRVQVSTETRDKVEAEELRKTSEGVRGFKERFLKSRGMSQGDPAEMVPAKVAANEANEATAGAAAKK